MEQKPSKKTLFFASILLLLSSILISVLVKVCNFSEVQTLPNLNSSITPTPYSLPTQVYNSPSIVIKVFRQIFKKENSSIDTTRIIEDGQRVAENPYMDLYSENSYLPIDIEWWQKESTSVYEYLRKHFNTTLSDKVIVTFMPPQTGNCAPRGTTFHEQQSIIVIFAGKDTSKEQILATLAHELAHVFIHKKFETLTDMALSEGLATWAAGDYWTAWKGSNFNSSVKAYLSNGTFLSLYSNYDLEPAYDNRSLDCIKNRDILLTEIASFVDYLLQNYGAEDFSKLVEMKQPEIVNSQRIIYPPDYKDVFGLELNQLEYQWLKYLSQPD